MTINGEPQHKTFVGATLAVLLCVIMFWYTVITLTDALSEPYTYTVTESFQELGGDFGVPNLEELKLMLMYADPNNELTFIATDEGSG